jgi:hypothetical protein
MPREREPNQTADQEEPDDEMPDGSERRKGEQGLARESEMESEGRRPRPEGEKGETG